MLKLKALNRSLYICPWSTDWLTHSLTHSIICPLNAFKSWQRWKNHTLAKLLQGFRQQVTWPTHLKGNNLRILLCNIWLTTTSQKPPTFQPTVLSVRAWWASPTRREKNKPGTWGQFRKGLQILSFFQYLFFGDNRWLV